MTKTSFVLMAVFGLLLPLAVVQAAEPPAENLMADEILGDGPAEPAPALDAGAPEAAPLDAASDEKTIDLRPAEQAHAAPEKHEAFERLDALKMSPSELMAFMKGGSLKSRVMKGQ